MKKKKYLIALPIFPNGKGFNHPTILVSGININDAIDSVYKLKGNNINIGDYKEVDY